MVNCTPDFERRPEVMDGAADVLTWIFGREGVHARSAVGFSSLPCRVGGSCRTALNSIAKLLLEYPPQHEAGDLVGQRKYASHERIGQPV